MNSPWIHTRSITRHHAPDPISPAVDVHVTVVNRFERGGIRAIVDVSIDHDGEPTATLEHDLTRPTDPPSAPMFTAAA